MDSRPRVLVAHGIAATRLGVRLGVEQGGLVVCGEAAQRHGAVAAALRHRPDICLVDARLPGGATATVRGLLRRLPTTRVVVLGDVRDRAAFLDALHAGAHGYLSEAVGTEALGRALQRVAAGEVGIPRTLVGALVDAVRAGGAVRSVVVPGRGPVQLSPRQAQVVAMAREGSSTSEIAARLAIDPVTVRRHLGSVKSKLGTATTTSALALLASVIENA
jgi:DNA-binding NarL/FixJ family response regulator